MNTKALRQKILDLAIRGKLVPQDPNDEPASVLLERIREQKQQMVKEGKLKVKDIKNDTIIYKGEDNLHYEKFADGTVKCIEDEIPFEVPEGWAWTRLQIIADIFAGGDKPNVFSKNLSETCLVPIYSNGIENSGLYGYTNSPRVVKPSITISARGTIGFCCIREHPFVPIIRLITITPLNEVNLHYLKIVFEALIEIGEGSSIPQLTVPGIKPKLIPIPPIKEQNRIQCKINNLLGYIGNVDSDKEDLSEIIFNLKNTMLNLAVRGKLVPQNSNDEPASVLLEHIRTEKEELIKQGKIKRDKKESFIFRGDDNLHYEKFADGTVKCIEDEIPFEIPKGWEWCRLKSICTKIIDGSHNPPKGLNVETPYIMASSRNIILDKISDLNNVRYLTENDFIKENIRTNLQIDDILLTTVATLGRSCIYKGTPNNLCFQRSVTIIKTLILPLYLKFYFDSPFFQQFIKENSTGTAQKGFYLNQLEMTLICIPPLDYQKQMVKTITDFMLVVSNIEKSLY